MELINNIKRIIEGNLSNPTFDIHLNENKKVVGFVFSPDFEKLSIKNQSKKIWDILKNNLSKEDINKITYILPETSDEKLNRLLKDNSEITNSIKSNFIRHISIADLSTYWIFLGVKKFDSFYKCIYIILNESENLKLINILKYDNELLNFINLEFNDIETDEFLYSKTLDIAKNKIKLQILNKYEKFEKDQKGNHFNFNKYNYIFNDVKFESLALNQLHFNKKEIKILQNILQQSKVLEFKELVNELNDAIKFSNHTFELQEEIIL